MGPSERVGALWEKQKKGRDCLSHLTAPRPAERTGGKGWGLDTAIVLGPMGFREWRA